MNVTFHLKHESLPKLKGEYQENLATYLYESDDVQMVVLNCLSHKLGWSEITLRLDKQDAPSTQEDQFTGDSLTLPNMVCTEVGYHDLTDDAEYQYSLYLFSCIWQAPGQYGLSSLFRSGDGLLPCDFAGFLVGTQ